MHHLHVWGKPKRSSFKDFLEMLQIIISIIKMFLSWKEGTIHLASGLDTLPDAEVADDPGNG